MAHATLKHAAPDDLAVWQARVDLAACLRMASRLGLHEGIYNHLSAMLPGSDDLFAWDDLCYLERACEVQRLALSTDRPVQAVPPALAEATARQMRLGDHESARLHLEHQAHAGHQLPGLPPMKLLPIAAALWLTGCTLVDQNTFNADASKAPVIPPAPKPPALVAGPAPLLRIPPTAKPAEYAEALRQNVAAARARKPTVVFDVVEMQPPGVDADTPIGAEAAAIGRLIVNQGVPPMRVRLAARPDSEAIPREVRVYVR